MRKNQPWSFNKAFKDLSVCFLFASFLFEFRFSFTDFCFLDLEVLSVTALFEEDFSGALSLLLAVFTTVVFFTGVVWSSFRIFFEVRLWAFSLSSSFSDMLSSLSLSLFWLESSSSWESTFASEGSAASLSSMSEDCFWFFPTCEFCFCF